MWVGCVVQSLQDLATVVRKFLPRSVSLQAWAELRMPDDAVDDANGSGLLFVKPTLSKVVVADGLQ